MRRTAVFSSCRTWRYTLERFWDGGDAPVVLFVLLNPSTANEQQDDPTNRRGIGFASEWGFGGVVFVNLFAFRTPKPHRLKRVRDPIGPDNDWWINEWAGRAAQVVVAWGVHGAYQHRDCKVLTNLRAVGKPLCCLGTTQRGHPRHILYLPRTAAVIPFDGPSRSDE